MSKKIALIALCLLVFYLLWPQRFGRASREHVGVDSLAGGMSYLWELDNDVKFTNWHSITNLDNWERIRNCWPKNASPELVYALVDDLSMEGIEPGRRLIAIRKRSMSYSGGQGRFVISGSREEPVFQPNWISEEKFSWLTNQLAARDPARYLVLRDRLR